MIVFRDIDSKPNLIPYTSFSSKGISGLGTAFIENALRNWDKSQALIMPSALRKIESLDLNLKADSVDANNLSFVCKNRDNRSLSVRLYPASQNNYLPSISVANGCLRKVYEVTYANCLEMLYLNLTDVYINYGDEQNDIFAHRTIACDKIELKMRKNDMLVSIKITRAQDLSRAHFMFYDEQYFLRDLAESVDYKDINAIWEYILLRSGLDFRDLCLEINVYQNKDEKQKNIGKVTMSNGKLFFYQKKSKNINGQTVFYELKEKELCLLPENSSSDNDFIDNTECVRELILASNKKLEQY